MSSSQSIKDTAELIQEEGDDIDNTMSYVMKYIIDPIKKFYAPGPDADPLTIPLIEDRIITNPYFFRALCVLTRAASLERMYDTGELYSAETEFFYLKQFINLLPSIGSNQQLRENIQLIYDHQYPGSLSIQRRLSARAIVPKEVPVVITEKATFKVRSRIPPGAAAAAAGGSSV